MRVWWVYRGGYHGGRWPVKPHLWAPTTCGKAHWQTFGQVRAGDIIVHYADGEVKGLCRATDKASIVPRPADHPGDLRRDPGHNEPGWQLLVEIFNFDRPLPRDSVYKLLPQSSHGPFTVNGTVKVGYLWPFDEAGLAVIRSKCAGRWPEWAAR